ncbi:cyclopropane fatty acyl phospholipid synthase [Corynebacterium ciconiae DSM 44920]|uniref:class I SAM-dependent methyltransferase n=1 Tax=Corynebacterium ciconiae TaxID=227319 RepID=UPI000477A2B0|nr:class I SAM-dependent methyltransferase [Corynebacterium ciconiae]WKD61152.1 cyclopropane fatty acyl phospholipid synthase [Corynebacterium ciconiae DSM 44920]
MPRYKASHLAHVDAQRWPGVATVPVAWSDRFASWRLRRVEAHFARALADVGLTVGTSLEDADVVVDHEELFYRLSDGGWLGLAESFMAGEWRARDLGAVLSALLATTFGPPRRLPPRGAYEGGELPAALSEFTSTDSIHDGGGMFASGVATTERVTRKSYTHTSRPKAEAPHHFVDDTRISAPAAVDRADLVDAQNRAIDCLLDAAHVGGGRDVLEYPLSRGAMAIRAAQRGASVDALSPDPDFVAAVDGSVQLAGVSDSVYIHTIDHPIATREDWRSRYESIVSLDKLVPMGGDGQRDFFRAIDRMLSVGGFAAIQTLAEGPNFSAVTKQALAVERAYIWPAMDYPSVEELHKTVDRDTSLRIIGEMHFASHYAQVAALQGELFDANSRDAAAAGFDVTFRRLWRFHLALQQALLEQMHLDALQLRLTSRSRAGRAGER